MPVGCTRIGSVSVALLEDEKVMLKKCRGSEFLIN
jgi:hypothetical protein